MGDIGIQPIYFNEVYHCNICKKYVEKCKHGSNNNRQISGTEVRDKLKKDESLPDWFIRESVLKIIKDEIKDIHSIFYR